MVAAGAPCEAGDETELADRRRVLGWNMVISLLGLPVDAGRGVEADGEIFATGEELASTALGTTSDTVLPPEKIAAARVIVERLTALGPSRIGVNGNSTILHNPRADRDPRNVASETHAALLTAGHLQTKDGRLSLLMHIIRLETGTHV